MKINLLGSILMLLFCCSLHAQVVYKRTVEHPGFVTANTSEIELKKIILTDEQTQVDAVLYGKPGTPAVISSDTWLKTEKGRFRLREAGNVSIDGRTEPELMPESGKLDVILSFAPVPRGIHEVDFIEESTGQTIYGVQLSRQEPYVYIPDFLKTIQRDGVREIPEPGLSVGKAVVNGYVLGYDSRMSLRMNLTYHDRLFDKAWKQSVKIRQDGSFHIETDMLQPDTVSLTINQATLHLFLVPGEEVTVYVDLPRLSMSASQVLHKKYGKRQKAWFDGAAKIINTELATEHESRALNVYRAVERDVMENEIIAAKLRKDAEIVKPLCERILKKSFLESGDDKILDAISFEEIRDYVKLKNQTLQAEAARSESVRGAVIGELDSSLSGADILPALIAPYRGKAILIDFWATWCAPCRKSMKVMRPLRKMLASKDIVYLYLTGPSSPELVWKESLEEMTGVHFRLTEAQWKYLCESYGITGIPGYLVISHDGKLQDRYVGFPGVDILQRDLLRAAEE